MWQMPWLAVPWITVTHCFTTQKSIYWQTTESSKCLMSYGVQTKLILSCHTLPAQTTLAPHSLEYIVQIQSPYL